LNPPKEKLYRLSSRGKWFRERYDLVPQEQGVEGMMGKVERACRDVFRYAMNKHEQYQCGISACFFIYGPISFEDS